VTSGPLGRSVLVPVANPASLQPLLVHAARLAGPDGGVVQVATVVAPNASPEVLDEARIGLIGAEAAAERLGVEVQGRIIVASDVASGVLRAIDEFATSLVLMGWRGQSSTTDVFGSLIDSLVGRSSVPLAVVRLGAREPRRVLLPVSADHLLPGGDRGLRLATVIAARLAAAVEEPTTVLRTGPRDVDLPVEIRRLGDRVHHDPRRTDQAVAAFARPEDLIVAAVAPTVSGLRAATTHLAWAAPDATLLVAIDVGPTREEGLDDAVLAAGAPAPAATPDDLRAIDLVVTVRIPDGTEGRPDGVDRVLRTVGATDHVMAWWPADDPRAYVRATVTVRAPGPNAAIARVVTAIDEAPDLRGAEITYDLDRTTQRRRRVRSAPGPATASD
jgi:hypothetical protein